MKHLEEMLFRWQNEQIVTAEQVQAILAFENTQKKSGKDRFIFILPYLAGLLLGLACLSFVAANWSGIPNVWKIVILLGSLVTFSELGRKQYENGHLWLGRIGISLGIVFFGASVILIAQMYQLISFSGTVFYIWSIVAWIYFRFYKEFLYLFYSFGLFFYAIIYESSNLNQLSLLWAVFVTILLFIAVIQAKNKAFTILFGIVFAFVWVIQFPIVNYYQLSNDVVREVLENVYPYFALLCLYLIGVFWKGKFFRVFTNLTTIMIFAYWSIQSLNVGYSRDWSQSVFGGYLALYALILVGVVLLLLKKGILELPIESLLLFLPFHYFSHFLDSNKVIILGLVIYSVAVLLRGYFTEREETFRYGSYAIIISILLIYFQVSFTYLSKSVFFLIAAILVFGMYLLLTRVFVIGEGRKHK